MITTRFKIPVTEAELLEVQSVSNNRLRLSEEIHRDVKHRKRGSYNPVDGTFEEFVEDHFID